MLVWVGGQISTYTEHPLTLKCIAIGSVACAVELDRSGDILVQDALEAAGIEPRALYTSLHEGQSHYRDRGSWWVSPSSNWGLHCNISFVCVLCFPLWGYGCNGVEVLQRQIEEWKQVYFIFLSSADKHYWCASHNGSYSCRVPAFHALPAARWR